MGPMIQIVLASTSVYRQELLRRLNLPFEATAPTVDESEYKKKIRDPRQLAETLAQLKARSLAQKDRVVIGGDQVAHLDGEILSKPGNVAKAKEQLLKMQGRTHLLTTSVCLVGLGPEVTFTDITRLKMRSLQEDEIERYIELDQPLDCAGSYKIEKAGISLMMEIQSEDFTAIQGLPLIRLAEALRQKGFKVP